MVGTQLQTLPQVVNNSNTLSVGAGPIATFLGYKLGIFHHFNMATFLATDFATGSEALNTFAPTGGQINVTQWITSDVAAGAKYTVLTAKHVDGFCLWPSAQTSHTIAGTTWYSSNGNQNIAQAFITAAHAAGIKGGFYFNMNDQNWIAAHPGYTASQATNFIVAQLQELAAYGPDYFFLDSYPLQIGYDTATYATILNAIKTALPNAIVVVNNTGNVSLTGGTTTQFDTLHGDIVEWELDAGGMPPANNTLPGEANGSYTGGGNWFWHSPSQTYKTSAQVAADQVTANSRNANLLANFPPNQAGVLDAAAVSVLAGIPAAYSAALPAATSLAVPNVALQPNQFLRGPVSGAAQLAIAGYIVDADLQVPGCHATFTNQQNAFIKPQSIYSITADSVGAILNLIKRGQLGNSQGAVLNSSFLGQIVAQGWDGSAYGVGPHIDFYARENWNGTSHGSEIQMVLVKNATTTQVIHSFDHDGTIFWAGGQLFFNSGSVQFNNTLTVQQAGTGVNPVIYATDGTIRIKMQVATSSSLALMGTESNHDAAFYTNSTRRFTYKANGDHILIQQGSATAIATSGTINTQGQPEIIRVAPTGNVTGVIMQIGTAAGHTIFLRNESAFTLTFAAQATSNVAGGTSVVVAAWSTRAMTFDGTNWN